MILSRPYPLVVLLALIATSNAFAAMEDDPLLAMLRIDQLELRDADEHKPLIWEAQGWVGKDLQKLWLKTEGERAGGTTEEAELQLLYGQAIAPTWDLQLGVRRDFLPKPNRNWAAIGVQGLAPYLFEVDTALFIGESGRTALRLEAEYELLFSQRLVLTPEVEVNLHGKDDREVGIGAGLSELELGLRLRYEIRRELAPYIGVNWSKKWGTTADLAREAGERSDDTQLLLGLHAWF